MGRSSSVVDEEADLMSEEGAQRGIVDVKVDGASRDGGVCMNYRTHAAPPGDYQDDMHAEVGGGLACEQQVGSSLSIVYTFHTSVAFVQQTNAEETGLLLHVQRDACNVAWRLHAAQP